VFFFSLRVRSVLRTLGQLKRRRIPDPQRLRWQSLRHLLEAMDHLHVLRSQGRTRIQVPLSLRDLKTNRVAEGITENIGVDGFSVLLNNYHGLGKRFCVAFRFPTHTGMERIDGTAEVVWIRNLGGDTFRYGFRVVLMDVAQLSRLTHLLCDSLSNPAVQPAYTARPVAEDFPWPRDAEPVHACPPVKVSGIHSLTH